MNDFSKNLLGLLTLWPVIYIIVFVGWIVSAVGGGTPGAIESFFPFMMVVHVVTMLLALGLTAFYLVHAVRDPGLSSEHRIIWVIVLLTTGLLGMPIYYWCRILGSGTGVSSPYRRTM